VYLVLDFRCPGFLAGIGGLLVDSVRAYEYVTLPEVRYGEVFLMWSSAETDPTYDQVPICAILNWKDEVQQEQQLVGR